MQAQRGRILEFNYFFNSSYTQTGILKIYKKNFLCFPTHDAQTAYMYLPKPSMNTQKYPIKNLIHGKFPITDIKMSMKI